MIQSIIHYFLHLVFPVFLAFVFFNKPKGNWKCAYLLMLGTMLVDLDHLLASPIFDPERCSIGFHSLHTFWVFPVYAVLFIFPKTRIIGLGLCLHMLTDWIDCM